MTDSPASTKAWRRAASLTSGKEPLKLVGRLASYRRLIGPAPKAYRKFLIWSQSRSGTTLLTRLLGAHPDIECTNELLRRWVPWPALYVESQRRRFDAPVFGFKVFIHHLLDDQRLEDPRRLLAHLHRAGYRIIYLKRHNLLRHSLSQSLRHATGVTHSKSGNVIEEPYRIDVDYLLRHMRRRDRLWQEAELALADLPYHQTCYETDLENSSHHQRTADRIFSFLGVDSTPVRADLKRINDKRLPDLIENYDEVVRALEDTPYAIWLEDPEPAR